MSLVFAKYASFSTFEHCKAYALASNSALGLRAHFRIAGKHQKSPHTRKLLENMMLVILNFYNGYGDEKIRNRRKMQATRAIARF